MALRLDAALMRAPVVLRAAAFAVTFVVVIWTSLGYVPRAFVDYSRTASRLRGIAQPETYGTDTIADMYESKVVLNDVADMYTKRGVDQTPLEAATWSKAASAPYPPAVLLAMAGVYAVGERTGVGFYGLMLALACAFLTLSAVWFFRTRWYLFPLLYLDFSYFADRFVSVQDDSYLIMLVVVMASLLSVRRWPSAAHLLMGTAIALKLSPLYYLRHLAGMRRGIAIAVIAIVVGGLVAPYFVWENYLYIFRFSNESKGSWLNTAGALTVAVPFAVVLCYVEARAGFDWADRIGWSLVPFAIFFSLKMNAARHLLLVLLVPDRRAVRNVAAALALGLHTLFPSLIRMGAVVPAAILLLGVGLVGYLDDIGWDVVLNDLRHPTRTARLMLSGQVASRRPATSPSPGD